MPRSNARAGYGWSMGAASDSLQGVHRKVLAGLPYAVIGRLGRTAGLEPTDVIRSIAMSASTHARRKLAGRLSAAESQRVARLALMFERATELFDGDRPAARRWLQSPARALGGVPPIELAGSEFGAREVEDLIIRLEHGVFT